MLFNSLHFLLFFPIVVLIYFLIPKKARWVWLLIASYYYYMCWNAKYALLLAGTTLVSWLSGLLISNCAGKPNEKTLKKLWVALSLVLNLGVLFLFKYFDFGLDFLNRVLRVLRLGPVTVQLELLLPVGISFYILQEVSYTMDVYRGEVAVERNPFRYALFVSFFPQLLAGPIERSKDHLAQFSEEHSFDYDRVKRGLWLMLWGYFQKLVIADRVAIYVNTVFGDPQIYRYGGVVNVIAMFFNIFQIYADFAGYSNLARGAAEVLGFRLTTNFVRPFFSDNITELWKRWHVSLSRWFTSYLYIPLGGSRRGKLRRYINVMIIFLVSGLWHGADWTYLIWGGLNGAISVCEHLLDPLYRRIRAWLKFDDRSAGWKCVQSVYVMTMFALTMVFFRAETFTQAREFFAGMRTLNVYKLFNGGIFNYGLDRANFLLAVLALGTQFVVSFMQRGGTSLRTRIEAQPLAIRWALILGGIAAVVLFGIYGPGFDASRFVYFQF